MRIEQFARGVVLACALLASSQSIAAQQPRAKSSQDTVLFICEHGSVRSLIATLLFEKYARQAGLPMTAISRGTAIDSVVPSWLERALTTDQFAIGAWRPQALATSDLAAARYVVSFDLPSATTAGTRGLKAQWDGLPSVSANYTAGRDAIDSRVRRLVDSLQAARTAKRP